MKVTILDDWFDTLRLLPCFEKLGGHEVTVWNDHVEDVDVLVQRLQACEALVLIRERTAIRALRLVPLPCGVHPASSGGGTSALTPPRLGY